MALCFSCKHKPGDKYKLKGHIRQRGRDKWVRQLEYIRDICLTSISKQLNDVVC